MNHREVLIGTVCTAVTAESAGTNHEVRASRWDQAFLSCWQITLDRALWESDQTTALFVLGGCDCAIAEIARQTMTHDFRNIDPWNAKILLVEGSDKLVKSFAPKLTDYTKKTLEGMGVNVWLDKVVTEVTADGVKIGDEFIPTTNVIWAAGNMASPLLKSLNTELDKAGRTIVSSDLSIPGFNNIFVISQI